MLTVFESHNDDDLEKTTFVQGREMSHKTCDKWIRENLWRIDKYCSELSSLWTTSEWKWSQPGESASRHQSEEWCLIKFPCVSKFANEFIGLPYDEVSRKPFRFSKNNLKASNLIFWSLSAWQTIIPTAAVSRLQWSPSNISTTPRRPSQQSAGCQCFMFVLAK